MMLIMFLMIITLIETVSACTLYEMLDFLGMTREVALQEK